MLKDVSIEYAHIYTNNHISEEQKLSLDILSDISKEYSKNNTSLVVMVDDYSFPDPSFDYKLFTQWLKENGFQPDIMLRESQLIPSCDQILHLIKNEKLKTEISDYIKVKKYPCSLFVASWYLLRLGYIESSIFNQTFVAKKLINILPLSFKPFEDKGFKIIESTSFSEATDQIENKYFEGRLIGK